jgi:hypothetical protein
MSDKRDQWVVPEHTHDTDPDVWSALGRLTEQISNLEGRLDYIAGRISDLERQKSDYDHNHAGDYALPSHYHDYAPIGHSHGGGWG